MAAPRSGWSGALGEFSLSGSAVQKAAGLHGDEITVGHDDVVQQADIHGGQSVPHLRVAARSSADGRATPLG